MKKSLYTIDEISNIIRNKITEWEENDFMLPYEADKNEYLTRWYFIRFEDMDDYDNNPCLDISFVEKTGDDRFPYDTLTSCQYYPSYIEDSECNEEILTDFINEVFEKLNNSN